MDGADLREDGHLGTRPEYLEACGVRSTTIVCVCVSLLLLLMAALERSNSGSPLYRREEGVA